MKFNTKVMKVGNSLTITISKVLCDNYNLQKGTDVEIIATDVGLFIPLKPTELKSVSELVEEFSNPKRDEPIIRSPIAP